MSSGKQFATSCFNRTLNAVFFLDAAAAAVLISPDVVVLAALGVKLQQAVAVLVDTYDIPLLRDGADGVYNNTSYDFYNNIFFAVPAKKLLLPGMQQ